MGFIRGEISTFFEPIFHLRTVRFWLRHSCLSLTEFDTIKMLLFTKALSFSLGAFSISKTGGKPMPTSKTKPPMETAPPQEVIINIPLSELHPFPNHPFQVRDDDAMKETAESINRKRQSAPVTTWTSSPPTLPPTARRRKSSCRIYSPATSECSCLRAVQLYHLHSGA